MMIGLISQAEEMEKWEMITKCLDNKDKLVKNEQKKFDFSKMETQNHLNKQKLKGVFNS